MMLSIKLYYSNINDFLIICLLWYENICFSAILMTLSFFKIIIPLFAIEKNIKILFLKKM